MKKVWAPLVIIALAAGFWFAFKSKNTVAPAPVTVENTTAPIASNITTVAATPGAITSAAVPAIAAPMAETTTTNPPSLPAPTAPAISSLPPLTVLDNARVVMHNYATMFGENPVGDNSEITAALTGKNPKQVNFITEDSGLRVNGKGELIDAWGTPFFFHQLSAKLMEIRSAGEDKKLWTFDDLVTR